jgi:amidase
VRTPSAFCGLYGLRPTHGRISVAGMATQSPSFDTCGWFAGDAETFTKVGEVLLSAPVARDLRGTMVVASDCFAIAEPEVKAALAPAVRKLGERFASVREEALADGDIRDWSGNQSVLQRGEYTKTFAPWIERCMPRFSIEVGVALALGSLITETDLVGPRAFRQYARQRMADFLGDDTVLCMPTTPILPPFRARLSRRCSAR